MQTPPPSIQLSEAQRSNWNWWENNPMTYDWENTMKLTQGSREWFEEIDRRFLSASYFAKGSNGEPFGRYMKPELISGKKVLEIGCGMGTHASMLARHGADLTAIDLTQRAIEATKRRFEVFNLKGNILRADAEKQPFADASFDFVWTWGVIHHSSSFESCLAEAARVLRPSGRIMMMVYYRPSLVYYVQNGLIHGILRGQLRHKSLQQIFVDSWDGFYARVFTKGELRTLMEPYFKSIQFSIVGLKSELYPIPRTAFKTALEDWTPEFLANAVLGLWGSMIVVEAEKRAN